MADDAARQAASRPGEKAVPGPLRPETRSFEPAYLQIANTLSEEIAAGLYRAGDQLPTEPQLRAQYGVSPATVRRAIGILLDRGLVTTTQGKGTFVRAVAIGEAVFRLQDITRSWDGDESVDVLLLEARVLPADEEAASRLRLHQNDRVVLLRRLVRRDDLPLVYQVEHVVYDERRPLVEGELLVTSFDGLLRSANAQGVPSGQLTVDAVTLGADEAAHLRVPQGSPAFCLQSLLLDFDGKPTSWGRFFCRADKFRLSTSIGARTVLEEERA